MLYFIVIQVHDKQHDIFKPQKIFIFLKTQKYWIQNSEPWGYVCMKMLENPALAVPYL